MFRTNIDARELIRKARSIEVGLSTATMRALNFTAFDTRSALQDDMAREFDRPTQFTLRSPLVKQATLGKLQSEVFIRDQAAGGTPPSRYLLPQARGGARGQRPFEHLLTTQTEAAASYYAPGRGAGAALDQHGNVKQGVIRKILSQLQASDEPRGTRVNETEQGRGKRLKRQRRRGGGGSYFVLPRNRGKLRAGTVYERIVTAHGSAVRSVLFGFERTPTYRQRFDILKRGKEIYARTFPAKLQRELARLGR